MMIPLWLFASMSFLAFCLLISTAYLYLKLDEANEAVFELRNAHWIALGRVVELEARLEPFKAYEDQVTR